MAIILHLVLVVVCFVLLLAFAMIGIWALWRWISGRSRNA